MISLNGIEKIIKKGNRVLHALKGITLNIEPGEIFGIIGHPGAGKSALIRCINFLEPPARGSVIIDSRDLTLLSTSALREARRHIGMIFQQSNLLTTKTVFENVAFPLELRGLEKNQIQTKVNGLLNLTGLSDKSETYPYLLNAEQKQCVAIARALVTEPKILLCEEATGNLDSKSKHAILKRLKDINQERNLTIVLITHDLDVIKSICDRVAVLHEGEIIETSSTIDWYSRPKTEVSKGFIRMAAQSDLPSAVRSHLFVHPKENTNTLLRLSFSRTAAAEPFIAEVIQKFQLSVNILQAHLETFQLNSVGIMIVEIVGEATEVQKAIQFLEHKEIHIEGIGYVARTH
jgi:D-methionine transport system ATP-binding protein